MSGISSISQGLGTLQVAATPSVTDQIIQFTNNPKKAPEKDLIYHVFMWFNLQGAPQFKIQLTDAVKQQVIEAAYSYIDAYGDPQLRNFSLEGLQVPELVMLYRIFESYQKDQTASGRKTVFVHLSLIENKLKQLAKDPSTKQKILDAIKEAEDGNANVLKFRIFSIPETSLPTTDDPTKEATVISGREDVLITIFGWLGPNDHAAAKQVCKYWNLVLNNEVFALASKKRLQAASFFTSTRISRLLLTPGLSTHAKIAVAYGVFTEQLKALSIPRLEEHPLVLSIDSIKAQDRLLADKALIKFCLSLPIEVRVTLPSLLNVGVSETATAQNLRQELKISAAVRDLTGLNIHTSGFTILPPEIELFTSLTLLYLMNNNFSSLPVEITTLVNLEILYIEHNCLTSLPEDLCKLTKLKLFEAHHNQLFSLPKDLAKLENLEKILLYDNNLTSLPEGLDKLKKLRQFDLRNNNLSEETKIQLQSMGIKFLFV